MRQTFIATFSLLIIAAIAPILQAQTTQPDSQTQALLQQINAAYANLESLELSGTYSMDTDAGGDAQKQSATFSAQFQSPGKFRHEMKDDLLLVGTGEKVFAYLQPRNQYMSADQPTAKKEDLPAGMIAMLRQQDPSLALALSADPAADITADAISIEKSSDTIDGKSFDAIRLSQKDRDITMLFDQHTKLLRQMHVDLRKLFEQQRVPQVKKALLTIDYTSTQPDAAIDATKFAFAVPTGATLFDEKPALAGAGDEPSQALVGKPAPDVKLENLEGKETSPLVEHKGSVMVFDFWATWCPPCRAGLPHLAELYKDRSKDGLQVFAINLREDKEKVQQFLTEQKLSLPVLLDYNGAVAERYSVSGIPQTVVIGKDGTVQKVIVGFGPGSSEELAKAVDAAMSAK